MKLAPPLLTFLFAGSHLACFSAVELPDAEIDAYLARQPAPKIEAKPMARLQRDYEAKWLQWFERILVEPFSKRVDAALLTRAVNAARKGVMLVRQSPQRDPAFTYATMAAEYESLVKAGVDDPLLHWLHSRAIYTGMQDYQAFEASHKKAIRHAKFKEMPAAQRLLTMAGIQHILDDARRKGSSVQPRGEDMIEAAWQSAQEGSYRADEDEILDENLWPVFREAVLPTNDPRMRELCALPSLSEWMRLMLTGRYHECKAWLARGHTFASEVRPEGWLGFEDHRKKAVDSFTKAWKLRKESPRAARELLGIAMTGGDTGDKPEVWLQHVLDAQFDELSALRSVVNGLLPRWGGSHAQMLAFGLSCAATKRFDTEVPYFFFVVLREMARDGADWREFCRSPLVARVAVELCRQRVRDAPTPQARQEALSLLGAFGWLCGDYKTADQALQEVPSAFSRAVRLQIMPFKGWNEQIIRGECGIFSAGHEKSWRDAEEALAKKNLSAAEAEYQKVRAGVSGIAAILAESRLAQVEFERDLKKGGWVPLHVTPSLAGWQIQKGDWTGTQEGHLVHRGQGASAFIYHRARIGGEFQMRGEFKAGKSGLGVVIGHGDEDVEEKETWITCVMKHDQAYFLDRFFLCGVEKRKMKPLSDTNSFVITCHQGKITFEVNGSEIFTETLPVHYKAPHPPLRLVPDGHVGFCLPMFDKDNINTLLRCEVRLLPQDA